jgi:hypothetical protein
MITRRSLLMSSALIGAGALAGCTTAQIGTGWTSIAGLIQQAVAAAGTYVPTIESVIATAASLFGPGYAAIVTAASAAFNQVVAVLTNVVAALPAPALARLGARLRGSSPQLRVTIGRTSTGVVVHGWKA